MEVQEVNERIAVMSAAELAEVKAFVHELLSERSQADQSPDRGISFEEASEHVRTDYAHLLHKLSQ